MTPDLSWFRPTGPYVQQRGRHCIILLRGACSRGYKLERERERSSQVPGVLGMIEVGESSRVGVCSSAPCAEGSSSFYRPRRGELHVLHIYRVVSSPPDPGENSRSFLSPGAAEHGVGCGRRPGKLLAMRGMCRRPVAPVGGVVTSVGRVVLRV